MKHRPGRPFGYLDDRKLFEDIDTILDEDVLETNVGDETETASVMGKTSKKLDNTQMKMSAQSVGASVHKVTEKTADTVKEETQSTIQSKIKKTSI